MARAICSGVPYFITRDEELSVISEEIEQKYGIKILHPTEFIIHMDELLYAERYKPARFAGTTFNLKAVSRDDFKTITEHFQNKKCERKNEFVRKLRGYLAAPDSFHCTIVKDSLDVPYAMTVVNPDHKSGILNVPMIRITKGISESTFSYQMIYRIIINACKLKIPIIKITDPKMSEYVEYALFHFGFFETHGGWTKISLLLTDTAEKIAETMVTLSPLMETEKEKIVEWTNRIQNPNSLTDNNFVFGNETSLWPAKFVDAHLPCYVIPIRPHWAEELFDERLSDQGLFGRKHDLAFNVEFAYYRSAGGSIKAPARILWYVSKSKGRVYCLS